MKLPISIRARLTWINALRVILLLIFLGWTFFFATMGVPAVPGGEGGGGPENGTSIPP
ncbi:MAG: hypothetical protein ACXACI_10940 [Candidatus Hodarchaeales archaeon]